MVEFLNAAPTSSKERLFRHYPVYGVQVLQNRGGRQGQTEKLKL